MKKILIGLALMLTLIGCKPIEQTSETIIETHTDTITLVETVKSAPEIDTISIVEYIEKEKPVYYRDKNWEAKFTLRNDSLYAQIKHLTDSIEHINTTTKIDNFKSEKQVIKEEVEKKRVNLELIIIVLGTLIIGGTMIMIRIYFK